MAQTLYWYDLETFGRSAQIDRIAQFAGVRTTGKFEVLEEPLVIFCRITEDYLPDPGASLVTGITPQDTLDQGVTEYEFISRIRQQFLRPGTCVAGYNNIRFDDEFIRYALYRNFYDPYEREYANGNSRWDIIDLARAAHDLRPGGITWLSKETGKPNFRLEDLARANNLLHEKAHDALSDVYATIGLARLIQEKQPKLFAWVFKLRKKEEVKQIINLHTKEPFLYTSRTLTSDRGCTSALAPLSVDPNNGNSVICFDLRYDPTPLLDLSAEEIRERIFTPAQAMGDKNERIHLKGVQLNKCPVVSPFTMLKDENIAERLGIDPVKCRVHLEILKKDPLLTQKIHKVYAVSAFEKHQDPDQQLYSGGFFMDSDRQKFEIIHKTPPEELTGLKLSFDDHRIPELLWRFIGRNFPEQFSEEDRKRWRSFAAGRLLVAPHPDGMSIAVYEKKCSAILESKETGVRDKIIVKKLLDYAGELKEHILAYS